MTASLIDPAAVAAIKANPRRPQLADIVAPDDCALSPARAARLTDRQWRRAWSGATEVLADYTQAARRREDGTEIAAYLLDRMLDLTAYALTEFAGASPDPRRNIRTKADDVLTVTWDGISRAIAEGVELHLAEVEAVIQATLNAEREQVTAGADAAAREATEARRALDAASAQLTREREQWTSEVTRLQAQLDSERSATINRERTARNEVHQLRQDLAASRTVIASLNAECERLEAQAAAPDPVEVDPMKKIYPTNALEWASLCVFMRARRGEKTLTWNGKCLFRGESQIALPLVDVQRWRDTYATPEAMLKQLRAVVRPILRQVA